MAESSSSGPEVRGACAEAARDPRRLPNLVPLRDDDVNKTKKQADENCVSLWPSPELPAMYAARRSQSRSYSMEEDETHLQSILTILGVKKLPQYSKY